MPELNYTVIIQIINFVLLIFLLNIILYRPVRGIIKNRKEKMDSSSLLTDEWKREIEKYAIEIREKTDLARKQGMKELVNLRDSGLTKEKELVQDAFSQFEREVDIAKNEIKEKIDKARISLKGEIDSYAREMVEKIMEGTFR
ncbi:MAG: ATP synthase F0 subunit B [Methanosarcina sp.]|nr:ATP synthase F0 subunit B [Methanosarcina sp.]